MQIGNNDEILIMVNKNTYSTFVINLSILKMIWLMGF